MTTQYSIYTVTVKIKAQPKLDSEVISDKNYIVSIADCKEYSEAKVALEIANAYHSASYAEDKINLIDVYVSAYEGLADFPMMLDGYKTLVLDSLEDTFNFNQAELDFYVDTIDKLGYYSQLKELVLNS